AISAAGAFRSDDGGTTWKPINRGLRSQYIPDPNAEVGHCVHRIALNRSRPNVLFMQKHWDVMRSDDAGDSWHEVSGNLPTDFGFVIDVHAPAVRRGHDPEMIRVALPPHLRNLAHVKDDVLLEVSGPVTRASVLDALEARYPALRGTIRDHVTAQRRPFLRFFACQRDL